MDKDSPPRPPNKKNKPTAEKDKIPITLPSQESIAEPSLLHVLGAQHGLNPASSSGQALLAARLESVENYRKARYNADPASSVPVAVPKTDNPFGSRSFATQDNMQGITTFKGKDGDMLVRANDVLEYQIRFIAGRMGPGPYKFEQLQQGDFMARLDKLKSAGATPDAISGYLKLVTSVGISNPIANDGPSMLQHEVKVEQIPNLFLDSESMKGRSVELNEYAEKLTAADLMSHKRLLEIKSDLEANIDSFFPNHKTIITLTYKHAVQDSGIRPRVREAFNKLHPSSRGAITSVVHEGSNLREWTIACGNVTASSRKKKEAEMMARVMRFMDSSFDPDGNTALPSPKETLVLNPELLASRKRVNQDYMLKQ